MFRKDITQHNHPVKLVDELSVEEIKKINAAYYTGYYKGNLLIRVDKMRREKIEFSYIYTYDVSGNLVKAIIQREGEEKEVSL